jgi:hypothetical protein
MSIPMIWEQDLEISIYGKDVQGYKLLELTINGRLVLRGFKSGHGVI